MTSIELKKLLMGTTLIAGFTAFASAPTFAQDAEPIETTTTTIEEDDAEDDEVVVTGSRLKKDTFQSIVPLQVIDTDIAAEAGLLDPVEILQTNSTAGGQQVDSTFQGFVLENGPGSETIDLRGLGASRTLVLINGRRMAPAGVEGAPTQPSINLIPNSMVDNYDLLTDGASSVYGSDAVAGVINVVLKNDYDGLELSVAADAPEQGAGEDYTFGARYGINGDRGFIGGAIEYDYQDAVKLADRDFTSGCQTYLEETENGELRTVDISEVAFAESFGLSRPVSECVPTRLTQRFFASGSPFGSIYYQPGISNLPGTGFSDSTIFGLPVDGNGDGVVDVTFDQFSPNGQQSELEDLINQQQRWSGMINGELTLEGSANITPYFEALYSDLDVEANSGQPQLFPWVSADNPFNPCNFNSEFGTDCNAAYNAGFTSPGYLETWRTWLNDASLNQFGTDNCFGFGTSDLCSPATFGLLEPTGVLYDVIPIVGVRGDRNFTKVDLEQLRVVTGVKGDLPFINFGDVKDWSFDLSFSYSDSNGRSARSGIREDRLNFALGNFLDGPFIGLPAGRAPCEAVPGVDADVSDGCIPVNLFAPSLYESAAGGDFASQAERDYLFDDREFATDVSQTILDGIVQGDVFELPGGDASVLLGFQIRHDDLNSRPDAIARDGLLFGFFQDAGAAGDRTIRELYAETFIPLGLGKTGFKEFNLELAGRLTDDEFYGTNETFSVKAGYRPIDALLLRGTIGTSFRAPNLRELFLRGQSGFTSVNDPCAVPDEAFAPPAMIGDPLEYDRQLDPRTDTTLNNCVLAGLDPTSYRQGIGSSDNLEISTGGSLDLDPERSDSFTVGFSFEQPFTDMFDLELGLTYYEIDIEDTVVDPSAFFIINDCYVNEPNLSSAFCSRIERNFNDPTLPGDIASVDAGFINRDNETAKGFDVNGRFAVRDIGFAGRNWDFSINSQFNRKTERSTLLNGQAEEFVGEWFFPKWTGFFTPSLSTDRWRLTWSTNYIGAVTADADFLRDNSAIDENGNRVFAGFDDIADTNPDIAGLAGTIATCAGPVGNDVRCSPVVSGDEYWRHAASVSYRGDDWNIVAGVSNIFDKNPPLVDGRWVGSRSNAVLGGGYDFNGREFFVRLNKSFR